MVAWSLFLCQGAREVQLLTCARFPRLENAAQAYANQRSARCARGPPSAIGGHPAPGQACGCLPWWSYGPRALWEPSAEESRQAPSPRGPAALGAVKSLLVYLEEGR